MVRLFLTLYGALGLAVVLFGVGVVWLPPILLQDLVAQYYGRVTSGTFSLIEERLPEQEADRWSSIVAAMKPHFPHGIALHTLESMDIAAHERTRLEQGQQLFRSEGDRKVFLHRIRRSRFILELALGPTPEQEAVAEAAGLLWLVEGSFLTQLESEWPSILSALQERFDIPLALVSLNDPVIDPNLRQTLERDGMAVEGLETEGDTYLKRLGDSGQVLRAGPVVPPILLRRLDALLLIVLAGLVALAVMAWIRPLWRDLRSLDAGVRAFGDARLETRLPVRAGSPLVHLTTTFNAMAERMQTLVRSHRELTSAVSHELRTPLARLQFRLDLLREPASERERLEQMEGMRKDLLELEDLVSESLTYARLDREYPALHLQAVNLMEWVKDVVDEAQVEFDGLKLSCITTARTAMPSAVIDARQMARALNNLLRNARRHARTEVLVAAELDESHGYLSVEDDGAGVPMSERSRIFEPFARLDAARDRDSGGVGLGLAIVSRIAQWHGGKAWVEDSPLGGARFVVEWPAAPR